MLWGIPSELSKNITPEQYRIKSANHFGHSHQIKFWRINRQATNLPLPIGGMLLISGSQIKWCPNPPSKKTQR